MRQVLKHSLARGLSGLSDADRLAAAWTVACGTPMASHGEVVGFSEGVLVVEVTNPAWLVPMMSMRHSLAHEITRIAGIAVTAIHFEQANRPSSRRPSTGPRD